MKQSLFISFLLFSSINLISQEQRFSLGISGGTTFSRIKVENYLDGNYSTNLGFGGELSCMFNFSPHVFIMTSFGILQRGYVYSDETPITIITGELEKSYFGIELKMDHNYLNNDWLLGYQFGKEISVSICCGAFHSYYLSTRLYDRNYAYIDPSEADSFSDPAIPIGYSENEFYSKDRNDNVSNWDFGIVGCISLGYEISDKIGFHLSGKYHHGLKDISEMRLFSEEVSMYNRSVVTFVGIKVRI